MHFVGFNCCSRSFGSIWLVIGGIFSFLFIILKRHSRTMSDFALFSFELLNNSLLFSVLKIYFKTVKFIQDVKSITIAFVENLWNFRDIYGNYVDFWWYMWFLKFLWIKTFFDLFPITKKKSSDKLLGRAWFLMF